jgi:hypothetical protein
MNAKVAPEGLSAIPEMTGIESLPAKTQEKTHTPDEIATKPKSSSLSEAEARRRVFMEILGSESGLNDCW